MYQKKSAEAEKQKAQKQIKNKKIRIHFVSLSKHRFTRIDFLMFIFR